MINTIASPGSSNGNGGGIAQILPLKLVADKKVSTFWSINKIKLTGNEI